MADTEFARLAEHLVNERMAHYGYTAEQIEAASMRVDHYATGCTWLGGNWDCEDEDGKSNHPESDEYDETAEFVVWVLEAESRLRAATTSEEADRG